MHSMVVNISWISSPSMADPSSGNQHQTTNQTAISSRFYIFSTVPEILFTKAKTIHKKIIGFLDFRHNSA